MLESMLETLSVTIMSVPELDDLLGQQLLETLLD